MTKAAIYDSGRLERYLANIDEARASRARHVADISKKLSALMARVVAAENELDVLIAKVNQIRPRRHNLIGVSWVVDTRAKAPVAQPFGPSWYRVVHGRNNARHVNPIRRPTLAEIKTAFQGRDAGELRRLAQRIDELKEARARDLQALQRVVRALQYTSTDLPTTAY